jgi:tetratricopeptide (TPR) repeat protein
MTRWKRSVMAVVLCSTGVASQAAVDVRALWDYGKPELSEQRFREALKTASGDDALILQTQIARSFGLRRQFGEASALLSHMAAAVQTAGPEARARYQLELGRTLVSATHKSAEITPEARARARSAYLVAAQIARQAQLDDLAIDALHMLPFVDTDTASQLKWNQQALDIVNATSQPEARRWDTMLRNNTAYALHQAGRLEEALALFEANIEPTQRRGNVEKTRIAHWMVAWTLRSLKRTDEALAIQLRLERENDADKTPDPYVFEELAHLYRARNDSARAAFYDARLKASKATVAP